MTDTGCCNIDTLSLLCCHVQSLLYIVGHDVQCRPTYSYVYTLYTQDENYFVSCTRVQHRVYPTCSWISSKQINYW